MEFFLWMKKPQSHTDLQREIDNDGLNQKALSNYWRGNKENHFLML